MLAGAVRQRGHIDTGSGGGLAARPCPETGPAGSQSVLRGPGVKEDRRELLGQAEGGDREPAVAGHGEPGFTRVARDGPHGQAGQQWFEGLFPQVTGIPRNVGGQADGLRDTRGAVAENGEQFLGGAGQFREVARFQPLADPEEGIAYVLDEGVEGLLIRCDAGLHLIPAPGFGGALAAQGHTVGGCLQDDACDQGGVAQHEAVLGPGRGGG